MHRTAAPRAALRVVAQSASEACTPPRRSFSSIETAANRGADRAEMPAGFVGSRTGARCTELGPQSPADAGARASFQLMRPEDFIADTVKASDFGGFETTVRRFRREVARRLRQGPLDNAPDVEVAVGLARLIHDELEAFGTGGGEVMDDADMREALQAVRAVCRRLGLGDPDVPFSGLHDVP